MKRFLIAALVCVVTVASAAPLRQQILEMNETMQMAMMHKDFATMDKCMRAGTTSNFVYEEGGQKMNYAQMLANMKMGMGMMQKITKAKATLLTLKMHGKTASGTTGHFMTGIILGPDKKPHTLVFTGTSADTYVNQGGDWKLAKMEWKDQVTKMDGKKVDPAQMGH